MADVKKYVSLDKLTKYDAKIKGVISDGDAATLGSAKAYADSLASNYDAAGAAAGVQGKLDEEVIRAKAAEEAALKAGQDAQADVDALGTYVGTNPEGATSTNVVDYVQEKTSGIATSENLQELTNRVATAEGAINDIEADYLKAADKEALEGKITAEENRAKGIEGGLETRLKAVEDDYLKAADKAELAGDIEAAQKAADDVQAEMDAFKLAAEVGDAAVDTLKEIQTYITTDGAAAQKMTEDIAANKSAVEAVAGRMDTAEDAIDAVEGRMDTAEADIDALQAKFGDGEGSVADMIADAVAAEATLREQGDAAAEASAAAALKAAQDAQAAAEAADGKADSLNTAMDARVQALEAIDHEHANKALLDTYTQTEADLADAVAKKHAHANAAVLDGITAAQVTAWDAAEANAKAHADSLNTAMDARVTANTEAIAAFVEVSEEEINGLFA